MSTKKTKKSGKIHDEEGDEVGTYDYSTKEINITVELSERSLEQIFNSHIYEDKDHGICSGNYEFTRDRENGICIIDNRRIDDLYGFIPLKITCNQIVYEYDQKAKILTITSNGGEEISLSCLTGMGIRDYNFEYCDRTIKKQYIHKGIINMIPVTKLVIIGKEIKTIPKYCFAHSLNSLTEIDLTKSGIISIEKDAFKRSALRLETMNVADDCVDIFEMDESVLNNLKLITTDRFIYKEIHLRIYTIDQINPRHEKDDDVPLTDNELRSESTTKRDARERNKEKLLINGNIVTILRRICDEKNREESNRLDLSINEIEETYSNPICDCLDVCGTGWNYGCYVVNDCSIL